MDSAGLFSVGTIAFKDPVVTLAAGTAGVERLPGSRACCIWPLGTIVDADVVVPNEEDTRDGATVVGGEKNVPSSSVSRNSLRVWCQYLDGSGIYTYNKREN